MAIARDAHKSENSGMRLDTVGNVKRLVIKVGSAVLTGEKGLNDITIGNIAAELSRFKLQDFELVLVSSGAIASGLRKMGLSARPKSIPEKQAVAAIGQSSLMLAYEEAFGRYDQRVAQVLLTREDLCNRRRYLNARNTIFTLLGWRIIPVINENDTVAVDELKFGDNDVLAALISSLVEADLMICLTDIDGLFDCDPRINPEASRVPLVENVNGVIESMAGNIPGTLGRGGMLSKIRAAKMASAQGIPTIIANGKTPCILEHVFAGEDVGTLFRPTGPKMTRRKHWIAYTLKARGTLFVDDGAKEAIIKNGKSLLPSGIRRIAGRFDVGAPVNCADQDGTVFATGLVNYASQDIERIKGCKTSQIGDMLGHKDYDEVIHRDNLAILPQE